MDSNTVCMYPREVHINRRFALHPSANYHGLYTIIFRQSQAVQAGLTASINVPLKLIKTVSRVWQSLTELARCGNVQTKSDIQVNWSSQNYATVYEQGL